MELSKLRFQSFYLGLIFFRPNFRFDCPRFWAVDKPGVGGESKRDAQKYQPGFKGSGHVGFEPHKRQGENSHDDTDFVDDEIFWEDGADDITGHFSFEVFKNCGSGDKRKKDNRSDPRGER